MVEIALRVLRVLCAALSAAAAVAGLATTVVGLARVVAAPGPAEANQTLNPAVAHGLWWLLAGLSTLLLGVCGAALTANLPHQRGRAARALGLAAKIMGGCVALVEVTVRVNIGSVHRDALYAEPFLLDAVQYLGWPTFLVMLTPRPPWKRWWRYYVALTMACVAVPPILFLQRLGMAAILGPVAVALTSIALLYLTPPPSGEPPRHPRPKRRQY